MFKIISEYIKWRKNWDALCTRCGLCCYTCIPERGGGVTVDLSSPCRFLDEDTRLCRVFNERFVKFPGCGSLTLFQALTNPRIPPSCAYVRTFRVWRR